MTLFPDRQKKNVEPGRLLAVGDVHGCLENLERLMSRVRPTSADRVIFLGDYVDRGPDPKGVIEYLLDFGRRFPRSVFLKGNHEEMFLNFLSGQDQETFLYNGGAATLESYRDEGVIRIPKIHRDFLENLPLHHETENFIFVHAGLRPGIPLKEQQDHDCLWIRDEFLQTSYDWGKTVVFGHTPRKTPLLEGSKIGVDTGAVYGRVLTCCDVVRRECWSA